MVRCRRVTSTATQQTGFVFPLDSFVINDITKKPLVDSQKPVAFFKSLLQLHTVKGEWVLIGYSGIGMQSRISDPFQLALSFQTLHKWSIDLQTTCHIELSEPSLLAWGSEFQSLHCLPGALNFQSLHCWPGALNFRAFTACLGL